MIIKDRNTMNNEFNNPEEDRNPNFFCLPPFHAFWKTFPRMKPFFKKGFWH